MICFILKILFRFVCKVFSLLPFLVPFRKVKKYKTHMDYEILNHHDYHIRFGVFHVCICWRVSFEWLPSISVISKVHADFFFFFFFYFPDHFSLSHSIFSEAIFWGSIFATLSTPSILSRSPNDCNLLFCKHYHMLFIFSLVLRSSAIISIAHPSNLCTNSL